MGRAGGTRFFYARQRRHLYVSADGKCQQCGALLGVDWHAHHEKWFADGGVTAITNGLALCTRCHKQRHQDDKATKVADYSPAKVSA